MVVSTTTVVSRRVTVGFDFRQAQFDVCLQISSCVITLPSILWETDVAYSAEFITIFVRNNNDHHPKRPLWKLEGQIQNVWLMVISVHSNNILLHSYHSHSFSGNVWSAQILLDSCPNKLGLFNYIYQFCHFLNCLWRTCPVSPSCPMLFNTHKCFFLKQRFTFI